ELAENPTLMQNPYQCEVKGRIVDVSGTPKTWQWVNYRNADSYQYYPGSYTDSEGNFSTELPCDLDINVRTYSSDPVTFNVDGAASETEKTDDGNLVVLNDVSLQNQNPSVWGYASDSRPIVPQDGSISITLNASATDRDSSELSYAWTCPGGASAQYISSTATHECTLSASDITEEDGNQILQWSVTATDNHEGSYTYSSYIVAELAGITNHKPVIWRLERDGNALSCSDNYYSGGVMRCSDRVRSGSHTYTVVATDPDGNPLSYTSADSSFNENQFTVNATTSDSIDVTVTDQPNEGQTALSKSARLQLSVLQNRTPTLYVYSDRYNFVKQSDMDDFIFYLYVSDDFDSSEDLLNSAEYTLTDANGNDVDVSPISGEEGLSIPLTSLQYGTYTLNATITDSDNASTSASTTFTIEPTAAPTIYGFSVTPSHVLIGIEDGIVHETLNFSATVTDDLNDMDVKATLSGAGLTSPVEVTLSSSNDYNYTGSFDLSSLTLTEGELTVTLSAQDADNDPVTATRSVTVEQEPGNETTITVQ
ncbi:hypothetical protein, partial [Thiomicrorhabdus sp.]|uniref:hypothetical protein n=1 Tax=Thiomicrorhabdus sp. TaxID=2039724 RepID=UPI0029C6D28D